METSFAGRNSGSSIHEQEIPNVTTFKSSLRGIAATAIYGISITNDNYNMAIELLKEKFGKRQVIIGTLYSLSCNISYQKNSIHLPYIT